MAENAKATGVPCQVFSRVVGYLSPVNGWHAGKQQEFRERKVFQVPADDPPREVVVATQANNNARIAQVGDA